MSATSPHPLRAPFGWPVLGFDPATSLILPPPANASRPSTGGWVRFTTSVDDREEKRVTVRLAASGRLLGELDLLYAHSLEPFQLRLSPADYAAAAHEGVTLTLAAATTPLWILGHGLHHRPPRAPRKIRRRHARRRSPLRPSPLRRRKTRFLPKVQPRRKIPSPHPRRNRRVLRLARLGRRILDSRRQTPSSAPRQHAPSPSTIA